MKFVLLTAQSSKKLEEMVNAWLASHPVTLESMRFQYSVVAHDDATMIVSQYSVAIFYVPMSNPFGENA